MRWFAVSSLPKNEDRALLNLRRQGFTSYLPVIPRIVRAQSRARSLAVPLFPNYLFVQLSPETGPWRSINNTYGVRTLVKSGGAPAALPKGWVETMISASDECGRVSFASQLGQGDSVQFLSGPFAGLIGQLEALDAQGRVTVLMQVLGRDTRTRAHASELAPAGPR